MYTPSLKTKLVGIFFLPIRIITVITLLALDPIFNISWVSATMIFYWFFPIFILSFVSEGIISKDGLKANFRNLYQKYTMSLPIEFTGIASFALLSFSTRPEEALWMGIKVSSIVIGSGVLIELYHHRVRPRFEKKKLSDVQGILAIIAFAVSIVFLWIYFYIFINNQYLIHFGTDLFSSVSA